MEEEFEEGQVFTVAKLHYINGVVYLAAQKGTTDLQTLADNYAETTDLPPVLCTTFKVRVYVQTDSWSVAETVCLASTVSGAGGKYPRALCGRNVLYSLRHLSINTFASNNVSNISQFRSSSRNLPLKLSL